MIPDDRLRIAAAREKRSHEIACGIFGVGLIAAALFAVWALIAKRKGRIFGPILSVVLFSLIAILLASCLRTLLKGRCGKLES